MEIDANVYNLVNILLQVILWSLIISAPAIILTVEMYAYERYKKWKDKSEKELERIIIGKTNNKEDLENKIRQHEETIRRLELDVELLEIKKAAISPEDISEDEKKEKVDETTHDDPEDKKELSEMTIKQLQELARTHKLKWYSRMKKTELIKALESLV